MKQILFFFFLLLRGSFVFTQQPAADNLWLGTGKFILGTHKSVYAGNLKLMSADSTGKIKSYSYEYVPVKTTPFIFSDVSFNTILLSFNGRDKLSSIDMIATFPKTDSTDYYEEAKKAVKKLVACMNDKLKRKATEKDNTTAKNYFTTSYEWNRSYHLVSFRLLEGKLPGHEFVHILISFSNA